MTDLRLLIRAYGDLPRRDRWHMIGRWRLCPMRRIAAQIPDSGVVVDLGCGHGLFAQYLARTSGARTVIGIDLDADKIQLAQRLSLPNLEFRVGNITEVALPPVQAVTILDVFYLVPYESQAELLRACTERLAPGGVIALKEMAERPRWKAWLNWLEEVLAVRVLKITLGSQFYFRPRAEWEALLTSLGLRVETISLDRGYYHPHVLFIGRKL
jgi:2-polyprenyl-3-methyl-5-hydroxy-6-metoxy-1,4-benzoquinol methylase